MAMADKEVLGRVVTALVAGGQNGLLSELSYDDASKLAEMQASGDRVGCAQMVAKLAIRNIFEGLGTTLRLTPAEMAEFMAYEDAGDDAVTAAFLQGIAAKRRG